MESLWWRKIMMNLSAPTPGTGLQGLLQGMQTGGNFMHQIMQSRLERERQKQLAEQFKQELELKKQIESRLGANQGLNRQILQEQLLNLKHKNDPNWEYDQFNKIFGVNSGNQNTPPSNMPNTSVANQYPDLHKMFSGEGAFPQGTIETGNLDLSNRPQVPNPEGGTSTVYSMSIGTPEGEVLIPRVSQDGRILTPEQAKEQYRSTGQHMGIYSSVDEANRAAEAIHNDQAKMIEQKQAASVGATPGSNLIETLKNDPVKRAYFRYKYKFDPVTEIKQTPEQKLEDKKQLEEYKHQLKQSDHAQALEEKKQLANDKHEQKLAEQKQAEDLKNETKRLKVIEDAKKDAVHLQMVKNSLEKMLLIAKNNPDLFGHSGIFGFGAEKDAERFAATTDNPNAGAWETYGLQPIIQAEKEMSSKGNVLALKTSLARKPNFSETQGKAISKLTAQLEQIDKLIGENDKVAGLSNESKTVTIINPQGKSFKTTEANAKHLPAGWKRG
jgi:hypothetical protein